MKFFEMVEGKEYTNDINHLHYKMEDKLLYYFNKFTDCWEESTLSPMDSYEMNFTDIVEKMYQEQFDSFDKGIRLVDCMENTIRVATSAKELKDLKELPRDRDVYIAIGPTDDYRVRSVGLSFEQFDEIREFVNKMREFVEEVRG